MDKSSFLKQLRSRLSFLSEYDCETTVSYYNEIISDRMDNGMSEQEAVEGLGSIDDIVKGVREEYKKSPEKEDNTGKALTNLLMYALMMLLSFIIFVTVCTAICTACSAVTCVIVGVALLLRLSSISVLLLGIGAALILTALTLLSVPFVGYCKMGIKELSANIR